MSPVTPGRRRWSCGCAIRGSGIVLTVRDDGRGMPEGAATSSHGIRGMRERAMLVGATLVIDSRPGAGTVIELSIPRGAS